LNPAHDLPVEKFGKGWLAGFTVQAAGEADQTAELIHFGALFVEIRILRQQIGNLVIS